MGVDGIVIISDGLFTVNQVQLGELAVKYKLPVMASGGPAVASGGLMAVASKTGRLCRRRPTTSI